MSLMSSIVADKKIKILYIQQNTKSFAGVEHVVDTVCSEISRKFGASIELDVLYTSKHKNRPKSRPAYNEITRISRNTLHMMKICRRTVACKDYQLVVVPQIEPAVLVMIACLGIPQRIAVYLHGNPHRECSHWKAKVLFFLMKFYFCGTCPTFLELRRGSWKALERCLAVRCARPGCQIPSDGSTINRIVPSIRTL